MFLGLVLLASVEKFPNLGLLNQMVGHLFIYFFFIIFLVTLQLYNKCLFFLFIFLQLCYVRLTYNKLPIFEMYNLVSVDMCIHPWNYHHSKVMYLALILKFSSCPFVIHPLASPSPGKHWQTDMLLSVPLGHLFYCWVVFHCIDIPQFTIHSHVDRTTVCFQSVTITNTAAVNIWV